MLSGLVLCVRYSVGFRVGYGFDSVLILSKVLDFALDMDSIWKWAFRVDRCRVNLRCWILCCIWFDLEDPNK